MTLDIDANRAALGARLFARRCSRATTASRAATCHPFEHGGVDGLARAPSAGRANILRNTPTVFNAAFNPSLNWDGSARSLEQQADQVIRSPAQFDNDWPHCWRRCKPLRPTSRHSTAPTPTDSPSTTCWTPSPPTNAAW